MYRVSILDQDFESDMRRQFPNLIAAMAGAAVEIRDNPAGYKFPLSIVVKDTSGRMVRRFDLDSPPEVLGRGSDPDP